ncbi:hypothetical protein SNEBB_008237 [Seison nebaliae]|nr:hypothetical protein SNEBB_008237 [Seison nebaliae]
MSSFGEKLQELFPTKLSAVIFVSYMGLFVSQGLMVTASQSSDNSYKYKTIVPVFLTEVLKLIMAVSAYYKENRSFKKLFSEIVMYKKLFLLYGIPSLLYCFYNNLTFINLQSYDPTTYYLLLQLRVIVTGVLFQFLFKKNLSKVQWLSLIILMVGCITKQFSSVHKTTSTSHDLSSLIFNISLLYILIQVFCSSFAGVYNEYLLKRDGLKVNFMLQNMFMYADSAILNFIILISMHDLPTAFTSELLNTSVISIIVINALIGLVTAFFLRNLNSILKVFASALELLFTGILSWIIFSIPIDKFTFLAIALVSLATYLYASNPVNNTPMSILKNEVNEKDNDKHTTTV